MTKELKPCPSCGNHEPLIQYENAGGLWHCKMICTYDAPAVVFECNGVGETKEQAYEQAAEFWNTRYKRTCHNKSKVIRKLICSRCGSETTVYKSASPLSESCQPHVCGYCGAEVVDGD